RDEFDSECFRELIAPFALLRSAAVVRFRLWVATGLALSGIIGTLVHAQLTDEEREKPARSLKAYAAASASPDESPSPAPKAANHKRKTTAKPSPSPAVAGPETKKTKNAAGEEESSTPAPKKSPSAKARKSHKSAASKSPTPTPKRKHRKSSPTPSASPKKSPKKSEENAERTPAPHPSAAPTPSVTPQPTIAHALPVPAQEAPQVTVEKSGFEEDQGLEPPPSPPPRRFGLWPWTRSTPAYRYLTRSIIEEIRRAPVQRRRWQFIVVHNSGTRQGNAAVFDYYHRHVRRMRNGLAYQFVIGNGTSTGNGQIEVGDRWRRQINGGHVHSDYLNNISLGICLVGDFNRDQPTRSQLEACEELIRYLRQRCGKTAGHEIIVRPHREMNPPRWPTDCPGDAFPYSWFTRFGE
ncbi:MAG: N-acetylmuramoyl-L-alanine amidase, partial [Chthoniobacterales bacterium]